MKSTLKNVHYSVSSLCGFSFFLLLFNLPTDDSNLYVLDFTPKKKNWPYFERVQFYFKLFRFSLFVNYVYTNKNAFLLSI